MIRRLAIAMTLACLGAGAPAQTVEPPKSFVTTHDLDIAGKKLRYKAIAEELDVADAQGKLQARIFSTTYLREGVAAPGRRPVMFAFNGGPGSASIWLHVGVLGPKRVVVPADAKDDGAPPLELVSNSHSPRNGTGRCRTPNSGPWA